MGSTIVDIRGELLKPTFGYVVENAGWSINLEARGGRKETVARETRVMHADSRCCYIDVPSGASSR
jgi:uncharacterized protein Veg